MYYECTYSCIAVSYTVMDSACTTCMIFFYYKFKLMLQDNETTLKNLHIDPFDIISVRVRYVLYQSIPCNVQGVCIEYCSLCIL